jgi:glycosyltransferase involved in cell wall biosynthesis
MPSLRAPTDTSDEALLQRVSVVIPTLNEVDSIASVLARIPDSVREIIVVDGLSSDGTADVAAAARADVRIVHQHARGKGAAIRAGIDEASGEYIVLMDGDGSTDPAYIAAFARVLADGADIAKGSRFLPGAGTDDMTFHRRIGNWGFVLLARILFGARFTDITYGYNAVRRDRRDAMALEIDGWAQEIVTNLRMVRYGMRVEEVPTFEPRRIAGVAKLRTWSAGWAILRAILAERRRPISGLANAQQPAWNPAQPWAVVKVHGSRELDPALRQLSDGTPGILALGLNGLEPDEAVNAIN